MRRFHGCIHNLVILFLNEQKKQEGKKMIYAVTAIIILVIYALHLRNRIKSLKKRIDRLNREVNDNVKIFNHQSIAYMDLEDENEALRQKLHDEIFSKPTLTDTRTQNEIWNSVNESLNK